MGKLSECLCNDGDHITGPVIHARLIVHGRKDAGVIAADKEEEVALEVLVVVDHVSD